MGLTRLMDLQVDLGQQEKLIQLLASLPSESQRREAGTGLLLKRLHDDLQQPPASSLGNRCKMAETVTMRLLTCVQTSIVLLTEVTTIFTCRL